MISLIIQDKFYSIQNLQSSPVPQTINWSGPFFAVSYSKPALTIFLIFLQHRCGGEPGPNDKEGGSVECPECGQELKARHYLVNHFRTNHGRLPPGYEDREKFICDHCSSIFMTEDALRNHIEVKIIFWEL